MYSIFYFDFAFGCLKKIDYCLQNLAKLNMNEMFLRGCHGDVNDVSAVQSVACL